MPIEELDAGNRIDVTEQKEDPMDFALWKAAKEGEPYWESPWGKGRPGWHIECTAMIRKFLGETIDIHCGGQDLIFPHHENEIAQGECCTGKEYAHYWMHNGYINVDNVKMSKSKGNFFTTRDVAEKYGYETIKLMMVQSHYRSPFNYTLEVIESWAKILWTACITAGRSWNLRWITAWRKPLREKQNFCRSLPQRRRSSSPPWTTI